MKNKITICFLILISLFSLNNKAAAQCDDITLSLTPTTSTCLANGTIKVTLSGNDLSNIKQDNMQFSVSGDQDISWAHYADKTIRNLPAGTYTISLRAFCNSVNDWVVINNAATTTISSSYSVMNPVVGIPRKTLNCKPTGMIPISILNSSGASPFTVTLTSYPAAYTGATTLSYTSRSIEIPDLPEGDYEFTIEDNCSYTRILTATVGKMSQDYQQIFDTQFAPLNPIEPNNCNTVEIDQRYFSSSYKDEHHYFYTNKKDYFEVSFLFNDTGTHNWEDILSNSSSSGIRYQFPASHTIKTVRDGNHSVTPYLRVKGTSCIFKLNEITLRNPYPYLKTENIGCSEVNIEHNPYNSSIGVFCYPYKWRVLNSDGTVFRLWQENINDRSVQYVSNAPAGGKIEFQDNEGYIWTRNIPSPESPNFNAYNSAYDWYGMTNGYYHSFMLIYISNNKIPAGTKIEFVSGPTTPLYTNVTLTDSINTFYPFSSDYTNSERVYIKPGVYKFNITMPGPGCTEKTLTTYHSAYKLKTPLSYTKKETCNGLAVFPTGQISRVSSSGTEADVNTYFRIYKAPTGVPYDNSSIQEGDSLILPASGEYVIQLSTSNSKTSSSAQYDTIVYEKSIFTLNPTVTSSFVCAGETTGFIRVEGTGGSGNYLYELYDTTALVQTNTTGIFDYGTAGNSYTVKLIDNEPGCGASYTQEVNMIDLGIAQIAFTSNAGNLFCLDSTIHLKCITLGTTTYEWSGPGITAANQNEQNPSILASDLGTGSYTYTIKVTPEGCGSEMQQNITVHVEDCSGAKGDYATTLIERSVEVDILANDGYSSSCIITPVITTSPMNGTYTLSAGNIIEYTPNTGFTGKDSMSYSVTCNSNTTTAKVYIIVSPYPDNISGANCYVTPQATAWSIKELTNSASLGVTVYSVATPFTGDIDNDGKMEIVVLGGTYPEAYTSKIIHILEVENNQLKLQQTLSIPSVNGTYVTPLAIANVDGGNYASIFICTSTTRNTIDARKLIKYTFDGSQYNRTAEAVYSTIPDKDGAIPLLADFNADGIPEVVAGDKIYNAQTLTLLADGNLLGDPSMGLGYGAYPNTSNNYSHGSHMAIADVDDDGIPEILGGHCAYKVTITNPNGTSGNSFSLWNRCDGTGSGGEIHNEVGDGCTAVADMNGDGLLEVVVTGGAHSGFSGKGILYIWNPRTKKVIHTNTISNIIPHPDIRIGSSPPFVGDVDNDNQPEIGITGHGEMYMFEYNIIQQKLVEKWKVITNDLSAATTMSMFDFNQDGSAELVYRDEDHLRIINGNDGTDLTRFSLYSGTVSEHPIVADVNNDGAAEIIVTGCNVDGICPQGNLYIYASDGEHWAPARTVWNQYAYNALNINEDLSVPQYPVSPATIFPGDDGILGTSDDIRPYNNFLQQQTTLNSNGNTLWLTPDLLPDPSVSSAVLIHDSVAITVGILNQGDAAAGSPIYITLYKDVIDPSNIIKTESFNVQLHIGDDTTLVIGIPDINPHLPMRNIVARVNDDGTTHPFQAECDTLNGELPQLNPALSNMMQKDATLNGVQHNGFPGNPVSVLFNEHISYEITAVNATLDLTGTVVVKDTLPYYLNYVPGSISSGGVRTSVGSPARDVITWTLNNVASMVDTTVSVKATPESGACATQPLFFNKAWVTIEDTITVPTGNMTHHQGAGVSIITFSASFGGEIFNAREQALDYKTAPSGNILIVPDEGYQFAGWSHQEYHSLRGELIEAKSGIMHHDTLIVHGRVELRAEFAPEEYPITYFLNHADNHELNPPEYTILSDSIKIHEPSKRNDEFLGWTTGDTGHLPQKEFCIPKGSTGEVRLYAHFLHTGREKEDDEKDTTDNLWSENGFLFIETVAPQSNIRIYSTDGKLHQMRNNVTPGLTKINLAHGVYIVTINGNAGRKILMR